MTPPWMLIRLAIETSAHHAAADEQRLQGLNVRTVDQYRAFLARIFGFEAVVERTLLRLLRREHSALYARMRTPLIREDLRELGLGEPELAGVELAAAHIPSLAHGLGWMFVLERHTLLAGQLRRHIERVFGGASTGRTRYLGALGDRPAVSFRTFGETLGDFAQTYAPGLIAQGAQQAFRAQQLWYAAPQQRRETAGPPARGPEPEVGDVALSAKRCAR